MSHPYFPGLAGPVRLGRAIPQSIVAVSAPLIASLVVIPVALRELGTAGYGVWTTCAAIIMLLYVLDAGLGATLQRFVASRLGAAEARERLSSLLWTGLALYTAIGTVLGILLIVGSTPIASLLAFSPSLREDAAQLLRIVGLVVPLGFFSIALGAGLQGLGRFGKTAVASAVGSVAFVATAVVLLGYSGSVTALGHALAVQYAVSICIRATALRDVLLMRPRFLARGETVELLSFSARLGVTGLSGVVNQQSDRVVVGFVASASVAGQLGIASQVVDGIRLLALAAFAAVVSHLSAQASAIPREDLDQLVARLNRRWVATIVGGIALGVGCAGPALQAWLGSGYGQASLFAAILILAHGTGLLTASLVAALRAVGFPSLEARYGLVVTVLNLVTTIPLAIVFGVYGILAGTTLAYALGQVYILARFHAAYGAPVPGLSRRDLLVAPLCVLAGNLGFALGTVVNAVLSGVVAVAVFGLVALGIFGLFLRCLDALGLESAPVTSR